MNALAVWLGAPEQAELRRAFETMLTRVLPPKLGADAASLTLTETKTMLETHLERWEHEWRERGLAEGREKGITEGRAEGRAEGETVGEIRGQAAVLLRLFERRFGPLGAEVRDRVTTATPKELLLYSERVLDAADIDSIFRE